MWLPEQQDSWRTRLEPAAAGLLCVKACRSVALCPATTPENSSVRVSSGDAVKAIYSHLLTAPLNGYLIKCVYWECKSRDAHSCGSTFWINLAQTLKLNQRNCSWLVIYEKCSRKRLCGPLILLIWHCFIWLIRLSVCWSEALLSLMLHALTKTLAFAVLKDTQ